MKLIFAIALVGTAMALELTPANFDQETAGKTVFLKFFAPWCGHCKAMKPSWDSLMAEYKDHKTILVADVDCTAEGKPLCDAEGVQGFPTLKHGEPSALEAYEGGRDAAALGDFAKSLKPSCSPVNIDLCDAEGKAKIEAVAALSDAEIDAYITEGEQKMKDAENHFNAELEKLQANYKKLTETKEATIAEVKASGLGLYKSIKANKAKAGAAKEEL